MAESRVDELRHRLERDPGSRLFAQLAEQLRKEGDVEEAIGVARAGLEKHPDYPSARLTLGRALLDSGDAAAARAELETAVRDAPDNILASRLLGEALETLGDLEAAAKQLRATLVIAPGDAQIQSRIQAIEAQLAKPGRRDHTKPMKAVNLKDARAAAEGTGAAEPARPATPPDLGAEDDDKGEGGLPATIRIRMPGDPVGGARAPMPPVPPATEAGAGHGEAARPQLEAQEVETTVPPASGPPEPAPGAGDRGSPEPPPAADESARGSTASAPPVGAPKGGEARSTSPPVAPASRETTRAPIPPEPAVPSTTPDERAAGDSEKGETGSKPLSSATLAELYLQQGLLERAIEVYRELLEAEPDNDGARARLAELEASLRASEVESQTPAGEGVDERPAKREVLERTIKRLEALLAIVRRR